MGDITQAAGQAFSRALDVLTILILLLGAAMLLTPELLPGVFMSVVAGTLATAVLAVLYTAYLYIRSEPSQREIEGFVTAAEIETKPGEARISTTKEDDEADEEQPPKPELIP